MATQKHHVQSVLTTFRIITALQEHGGMRVTQIAQETGIAKSSVFKHLDTLRHLGYVSKNDSQYSLSLQWFRVGQRIRSRYDIVAATKRALDRFARRTGETVSLVVEESGDAVYLYQTSDQDERQAPTPEGGRMPCSFSVGGKAILAYRPEDEVRTLLTDRDRREEPDTFLSELADLRDQRIVIEFDDPHPGALSAGDIASHHHVSGDTKQYRDLHSVAVPVRNADGYGVAAIEVSGDESRLHQTRLETEIASRLVDLGESIETDLLQRSVPSQPRSDTLPR